MKKLLLLLFCCPFLAQAQKTQTTALPKREFAIALLPFGNLMGMEVKNQPFYIEFRQQTAQNKYLRLGIQTLSSNTLLPQNPSFLNSTISDSLLVIDTRNTNKNYGHLRIGTEYQKSIKKNENIRVRLGLDGFLGVFAEYKSGTLTTYNLLQNKATYKFNDSALKKFSAGCGSIIGVDFSIGKKTALGLNFFTNVFFHGTKNTSLELDMRISPYFTWRL